MSKPAYQIALASDRVTLFQPYRRNLIKDIEKIKENFSWPARYQHES